MRLLALALALAGTVAAAHERRNSDYHAHEPGALAVSSTTFVLRGNGDVVTAINPPDSNRPRFVLCLRKVRREALDGHGHVPIVGCGTEGSGVLCLRLPPDDLDMLNAAHLGYATERPMSIQVDGTTDGRGPEDHCLVTRVVNR